MPIGAAAPPVGEDVPSRSGWDLPASDALRRFTLAPGATVEDQAQGSDCCFLIESGLVATYVMVDQTRPTCIGVAGSDEMLGLERMFGGAGDAGTQNRAIVPVQGTEVPATWLRNALNDSPPLRELCLQQMQARLSDTQRVAACNARHLLPERCAQWLVRLHAWLGDALPVTHEFLATMLGVRRAGVTVTLQALQRAGAIRQHRGRIAITDVQLLRNAACSCPAPLHRTN